MREPLATTEPESIVERRAPAVVAVAAVGSNAPEIPVVVAAAVAVTTGSDRRWRAARAAD